MPNYPVYPEKKTKTKSVQNLSSSLEKELHYLSGMVAEPTTVTFLNKSTTFLPATEVRISDTILRRYCCLDHPGCTTCCCRFWNCHLRDEMPDHLVETYNRKVPDKCRTVDVAFSCNTKAVTREYFCYDHTENLCTFENGGCDIHEHNPVSCMFPLIQLRFNPKKQVLRIGKQVFGRNHLIGCPVSFLNSRYTDPSQFEADTVNRFLRYQKYLDLIGIPHICGKIVTMLREKAQRRIKPTFI